MKNVAGYDISRALAGSLGTLGMILDVSLKVVPRPAERANGAIRNFGSRCDAPHERMGRASRCRFLQLHGTTARCQPGCQGQRPACARRSSRLGGNVAADDCTAFWKTLREQSQGFFNRTDRATLVAPVGAADDFAIRPRRDADRMARRVSAGSGRPQPLPRFARSLQAVGGHATAFPQCRQQRCFSSVVACT